MDFEDVMKARRLKAGRRSAARKLSQEDTQKTGHVNSKKSQYFPYRLSVETNKNDGLRSGVFLSGHLCNPSRATMQSRSVKSASGKEHTASLPTSHAIAIIPNHGIEVSGDGDVDTGRRICLGIFHSL